MALLKSINIPLGTKAIDFCLKGVDGKMHSPADYKDKDVLVIVIMCNHCPYVQAVDSRLVQLQEKFAKRNVQFIGINPNDDITYPEDNFENMVKRASEKGYNFPYLRDDDQSIAKKYQAQCTPDIYVYDKERELCYHGRVDDNWQEPDKATSHDLSDAIEALLEGKKPSSNQHPSMGCSIKWKE
ncbi:MAG: thioredoxin family protein [Candidatus Scalindua sediminis]|nr:thioredoxin family protein [Candidatus Scalindua sediminis]